MNRIRKLEFSKFFKVFLILMAGFSILNAVSCAVLIQTKDQAFQ